MKKVGMDIDNTHRKVAKKNTTRKALDYNPEGKRKQDLEKLAGRKLIPGPEKSEKTSSGGHPMDLNGVNMFKSSTLYSIYYVYHHSLAWQHLQISTKEQPTAEAKCWTD